MNLHRGAIWALGCVGAGGGRSVPFLRVDSVAMATFLVALLTHMMPPFGPKPQFLLFGGMCVMPLRANHAEVFPEMFAALGPTQRGARGRLGAHAGLRGSSSGMPTLYHEARRTTHEGVEGGAVTVDMKKYIHVAKFSKCGVRWAPHLCTTTYNLLNSYTHNNDRNVQKNSRTTRHLGNSP